MTQTTKLLHATTVSFEGKGALMIGPSGAGKSSLALRLMAYGCSLVADDQTLLSRDGAYLIARCPEAIRGQIEARGMGLLTVMPCQQARVVCCIDLGGVEKMRLPEEKYSSFLGCDIRLFHKSENSAFPEAVLQYLKTAQV